MFEVGGVRPESRAVSTTCLDNALINTHAANNAHAVELRAAAAACARK
jgi:hypothetical protein